MENRREIRVTGKGKLSVHPDMTRVSINLKGAYKDYAGTLEHSAKDTEQMKDLLESLDFKRTDVKTLRFNVEPIYESYKEQDRETLKEFYRRMLIGYEYEHTLKIEFASDNKRLGRILYALAHCSLEPEIGLSYFVNDPESVKNELLAKAVEDAKKKAQVLASAAGVKLLQIQHIDYSWGEINFEINPMEEMSFGEACIGAAPEKSYNMDIEPDDIETSDTVTLVWEIG